MKRLRLIKPWRLRTVRQRLAEVSFNEDVLTPCRGPVSSDGDIISSVSCREALLNNSQSVYSRKAPVSTVSFTQYNSIR